MTPATFRHDDVGTSEDRWRTDRRWADAAAVDLRDRSPLLVLAAHPDDETLGAGGLIATASALGLAVTVVVASLGENSHPDSPTYDLATLARIREREVRHAVQVLAPGAEILLLRLPDGGLAAHVPAMTAAVRGAVGPSTLIAAPWPGDRHPDHEAVGSVAERLADAAGCRLLGYPIWAWHWADPDGVDLPVTGWARLDLPPAVVARKRSAMAAHVSQHTPLGPDTGDRPVLTEQVLAHFRRPVELFLTREPR